MSPRILRSRSPIVRDKAFRASSWAHAYDAQAASSPAKSGTRRLSACLERGAALLCSTGFSGSSSARSGCSVDR